MRRALCLGAAATVGLAGCTLLAPPVRPAPVRHALPPGDDLAPSPPPAAAERCGGALRVRMPTAQPGADTDRMVYLRRADRPLLYEGHVWTDPPARLLWPRLVQALTQAGAWAVVLPPEGVAGEVDAAWRLDTQVVRLAQTLGAPGAVRFTLDAWLVDRAARRVVVSRRFDVQVPTARDDADSGVQAAGRAVDQVLRALAPWCAAAACAAPALPAPPGPP